MGASQISNAEFAQALSDSIESVGAVQPRWRRNGPLQADGVHRQGRSAHDGLLDDREDGSQLHAGRHKSGKTVWTKNVASDVHGEGERGVRGSTRLRLANEGAAKANIQQAITDISTLNL